MEDRPSPPLQSESESFDHPELDQEESGSNQVKFPEHMPPLVKLETIESKPENKGKSGPGMTKVEKLLHPEPKRVEPETVRKEVEKAAKEDLPVEKLYELRHEIKDDPLVSSAMPTVVLEEPISYPPPLIPPTYTPQASTTGDNIATESTDNTNDESPQGTSVYRQAIIGGFLAAVILLLFFGILAALT
jgi:hypothetical protein